MKRATPWAASASRHLRAYRQSCSQGDSCSEGCGLGCWLLGSAPATRRRSGSGPQPIHHTALAALDQKPQPPTPIVSAQFLHEAGYLSLRLVRSVGSEPPPESSRRVATVGSWPVPATTLLGRSAHVHSPFGSTIVRSFASDRARCEKDDRPTLKNGPAEAVRATPSTRLCDPWPWQ